MKDEEILKRNQDYCLALRTDEPVKIQKRNCGYTGNRCNCYKFRRHHLL